MTTNPTNASPATVEVEIEGTTFTVSVTEMKRQDEDSYDGPRVGLYAHMHLGIRGAKPDSYSMSLLVDEKEWVIDAKFGANSYPFWSHGFGARYLRCKTVHDDIAAVLDHAAQAAGLVRTIGRDVPLALAEAAG